MDIPDISKSFSVDDIHKVRRHTFGIICDMTAEQQCEYFHSGAAKMQMLIDKAKVGKCNEPAS